MSRLALTRWAFIALCASRSSCSISLHRVSFPLFFFFFLLSKSCFVLFYLVLSCFILFLFGLAHPFNRYPPPLRLPVSCIHLLPAVYKWQMRWAVRCPVLPLLQLAQPPHPTGPGVDAQPAKTA